MIFKDVLETIFIQKLFLKKLTMIEIRIYIESKRDYNQKYTHGFSKDIKKVARLDFAHTHMHINLNIKSC